MKLCIVDKNIPVEIIKALKGKGYRIVLSLSLSGITGALATHPDIQLCKISDEVVVVEPTTYDYYIRELAPFGITVIKGKTRVESPYPKDVPYNLATNKSLAIHNFNFTDEMILKHLECRMINVKQGYGKCNVAFAGEVLITSDVGIYDKIDKDALLISPGHILLTGYDYGFIGGATGFDDKLYFIGDVTTHPDCESITKFLKNQNIEYESLGTGALQDYGSLIFINTKEEI